MLNDEEVKEFQIKNIQVVQTFRIMNNPINFVTNYFRTNTELKEENFKESEDDKELKDMVFKNDNKRKRNN